MEGAAHRAFGTGFQAVVGQDGSDGEGGFDFGDGHGRVLFQFFFQLKKKLTCHVSVTKVQDASQLHNTHAGCF